MYAIFALLLSTSALGSPCAQELVLGRAPVPSKPEETVAAPELHVELTLRQALFDGIPYTEVAGISVRWTYPEPQSAVWLAPGWPDDTADGQPAAAPSDATVAIAPRQCESSRGSAPTVHAREAGPLTWSHGPTDRCRIRVPLDGPWAEGAVLTVSLSSKGSASPAPFKPSLPAGSTETDGSWRVPAVQGGDLVIDVPGCG